MKIRNNKSIVEKAPDRLAVLERIKELELSGRFDMDAENDPPTIELLPNMVDYLNEKPFSRIKTKAAYIAAECFLWYILKTKKMIIKDIRGIENFNALKSGAVITCNHFNPFDCFAIEKLLRLSEQKGKKHLFKVIREGNYTNFPGFYGFLFKNCETLPLSSNKKTMSKFMKAVNRILTRGDFVLIYPEQSMWWNYEKPKPLKNGAFKFAVKANVPVLPIFITLEDSNIMGNDGFYVKEYTLNISEPIYPKTDLNAKENMEYIRDENFRMWKDIYEDFYKKPLSYTTAIGSLAEDKE